MIKGTDLMPRLESWETTELSLSIRLNRRLFRISARIPRGIGGPLFLTLLFDWLLR